MQAIGGTEVVRPFSAEEYQGRLERTRDTMEAKGIDVLIVVWPENIYYLTGYRTPGYYAYQCLGVTLDQDPFMIVRHLEATNVVGLSWISDYVSVRDTDDPVDVTQAAFHARNLDHRRIGLELDTFFLSPRTYLGLQRVLGALIDGSGIVEHSRVVKSPEEVKYIREAARVAGIGMAAAYEAIREGVSENEVAAAVYEATVLAGSEYMSLPPFVASGPRSALAHATWEGRRIEHGDLVYLEISGVVARYSAALMRTVSVGEPTRDVSRRAQAIMAGLDAAIAVMHPGATSGEVDAAAREPIARAGIGDYFRHRTGYSIGLNFPPDWGEGHIRSLRPMDPSVLEAGMVFHLVPGILDPESGHGIGFSETVLVTDNGSEVLTSFPRSLTVR